MERPAEAEQEPLVDLLIEAPDWDAALPGLAAAADVAARLALEETGRDPAHWQVALLACDDARIAALNAEFRGRDGPTDVLSWPAFAAPPEAPPPGAQGRAHLGDVAISLSTARADAESRAIDLKDHVTHLILHACLHLLGFDHGQEQDARLMEGLETRALARIGVADPYELGSGERSAPEE